MIGPVNGRCETCNNFFPVAELNGWDCLRCVDFKRRIRAAIDAKLALEKASAAAQTPTVQFSAKLLCNGKPAELKKGAIAFSNGPVVLCLCGQGWDHDQLVMDGGYSTGHGCVFTLVPAATAQTVNIPASATVNTGPLKLRLEELAALTELFRQRAAERRQAQDYKSQGLCPACGDKGEWRALALFCTKGHGRFAG